MPLVLMTATDPGQSYWSPLPAPGLDGWSENGALDLFPDTNLAQNLGTTSNRVEELLAGNATFVNNSALTPSALTGSIALQNGDGSASTVAASRGSIVALMTQTTNAALSTYADQGSIAHGRITTTGSRIRADTGSLAGGQITDVAGLIEAFMGGIAHGLVDWNIGVISATDGGAAFGNAHAGTIISTQGGLAAGYAYYYNYGIRSYGKGAIALGFTKSGNMLASGNGAFAAGCVDYGSMVASGVGAFTLGYSYQGSTFTASGKGAFAMGYAYTGNITSSGIGSFAMGYTNTATDIIASGNGAVQVNAGTNSRDNSFKVGNDTYGIRLLGDGNSSSRNGDFWCNGTDVFVRTGGVIKSLSSI